MRKLILFTILLTVSFAGFSQANSTESIEKEKPLIVKERVERYELKENKIDSKVAKTKKSGSDLTEQQLIEQRKNLGVISDPLKSEESVLTTPNNN